MIANFYNVVLNQNLLDIKRLVETTFTPVDNHLPAPQDFKKDIKTLNFITGTFLGVCDQLEKLEVENDSNK